MICTAFRLLLLWPSKAKGCIRFSNQLFSIVPTLEYGQVVNNGLDIYLEGNSFPYSINFSDFYVWGDTVGSYNGIVAVQINSAGNYYNIASGGSTIIINIIQLNNVGGRIKGNYAGPCQITSDSMNVIGYLSGSFDVLRTQ